MSKNLAKTYNPKDFEDRIYQMWEEKGAFRAERDPDKKPFTIVMPPPNLSLIHIWPDMRIRRGGRSCWMENRCPKADTVRCR